MYGPKYYLFNFHITFRGLIIKKKKSWKRCFIKYLKCLFKVKDTEMSQQPKMKASQPELQWEACLANIGRKCASLGSGRTFILVCWNSEVKQDLALPLQVEPKHSTVSKSVNIIYWVPTHSGNGLKYVLFNSLEE